MATLERLHLGLMRDMPQSHDETDGSQREGALARIRDLITQLEATLEDVERDFREGSLNMEDYELVSRRLKHVADDFYSRFP